MDNKTNIKSLKDYFFLLRQRPGMYLGQNTISKLHDHLQGYMMAYWFNNIDNPTDRIFFDNFNDFVYSYYNVNTNDNWRGVILDQCFNNEQVALTTFFELYDLFISETKTRSSKKIVLSFFDKLVFQQENLKEKLGNNFTPILTETIDLLKENVVTNYKSDFDYILEQLDEKATYIPELKLLLSELENEQNSSLDQKN